MYRFIFACVLASIFATSAAAEMRPTFWGSATKLLYVSPTELSTDTKVRSLCVQVEDRHALYVPYHRVIQGYVLSDTNCQTLDGSPLPVDAVARLKAVNLLPATVPDTPEVPLHGSLRLQAIVLVFALAFCGLPWLMRRGQTATQRKMRRLSGDPLYFDALLSVLFHVARTDGLIDKQELDAIRTVYETSTGTKVTSDMTASHFDRYLNEAALLNYVQGYRGPQAEMMLDAAIQVAACSGVIPREKEDFLIKLNDRLERGPGWFDQTVAAALKHSNGRIGQAKVN